MEHLEPNMDDMLEIFTDRGWIAIMMVFFYPLLMFIGVAIFPPFMVCMGVWGGDLLTCTGGMWT